MNRILYISILILFSLQIFAQEKKAKKFYDAGEYEECIKYCNEVLKDDPKEVVCQLYKGLSLSFIADNPKFAKKYPNAAEQALECLQNIRKNDEKGTLFLENTDKIQTLLDNCILQADKFYTNNNYKTSLKLYEGLNFFSADRNYEYRIIKSAVEIKNEKKARTGFDKLIHSFINSEQDTAIEPQEIENMISLSNSMFRNSWIDESFQMYNVAIYHFRNPKIEVKYLDFLKDISRDTTVLSAPDYIDRIEKASRLTYFNQEFVDFKWNYVRNYLQFLISQNNYDDLTNLLNSEIATDTLNYNFIGFNRLFVEFLNTENQLTPKARKIAEILLKMHLTVNNVVFSQDTYNKVIEPFFNNNQISASATTASFFKTLFTEYNTAIQNIEKALKAADYSKASRLLRIFNEKYPADPAYGPLQKQCVTEDYKLNYLGAKVTTDELKWTGNTKNCKAGTISDKAQKKTLQTVNYFRRMAGVPDNVVFDAKLNAKCQEAALVMLANYQLTHFPKSDMSCYSADAAAAAGSSNLSLGSFASQSVYGQMRDDGANNESVGHRRWILYPGQKVMGHGSTDGSMALWVIDNRTSVFTTDSVSKYFTTHFIAWPPEGFVPAELVFERWSISLLGADFKAAVVKMYYANGTQISLKQLEQAQGYGAATMVWEPNLKISNTDSPEIWVEISNVKQNGVKNPLTIKYKVSVLQIK